MQKIPENYCVKTKKLYICTRNNCSLNKGEIPKWPTGADCNSADIVFVGSNPALPTYRGNSSVDRALAFQAGGRGFESRFPLSEWGSYESSYLFYFVVFDGRVKPRVKPEFSHERLYFSGLLQIKDTFKRWASVNASNYQRSKTKVC